MAEPMSNVSPEKLNSPYRPNEESDISWHEPPSSPFLSLVENDGNQENIAPSSVPSGLGSGFGTPRKAVDHDEDLIDWDDTVPQSAFKAMSPLKGLGMKDAKEQRNSPGRASPTKPLLEGFDEDSFRSEGRRSPKKSSPVKQSMERPESAMSNRSSRMDMSPIKSPIKSPRKFSYTEPLDPSEIQLPDTSVDCTYDDFKSPPQTIRRQSPQRVDNGLRDNKGLTVAIKDMEERRFERQESYHSTTSYHSANAAADSYMHNSDEPEMEDLQRVESFGSTGSNDDIDLTIDDTRFSTFSEMPNLDMTKFAFLENSPTKKGLVDQQATPRASRTHMTQMTPSTVRRSDRTPSPTPKRSRIDNGDASAGDTTNLLLDFTAQIEAFSNFSRGNEPSRERRSPLKSGTEPNLRAYMQNQRSPEKPSQQVPSTPSRNSHLLNLLDFELPPPPTPRSIPTVTIRELESMKSNFQSQISSLTASLSGKEAEVESLVKAVSNAERRVGEAHELVREERSAREHAEAQMVDWKSKGEEVQGLLQDVQEELARNDKEREALLHRLSEVEKRADDAEQRASELEHRAIEAESKNVDMTTFINPDEEHKKIYSEAECTTAIQERVNEVSRELHSAYKAKHEKKIKALKETYQQKAETKCKELRVQIIRLERKLEAANKNQNQNHDDTFSNIVPGQTDSPSKRSLGPCDKCANLSSTNAHLSQNLEAHASTIETLKSKLAGLESQLQSLRTSHDGLLTELEAERVEKGELVAAAEQMLSLCGEKMEELQQEEFRKSQMGPPRDARAAAPANLGSSRGPDPSMRATGFLGGAPPAPRPGSAMAGGNGRPGSALGERLGGLGGASERPKPTTTNSGKPSGLRAPGGFGFGAGGNAGGLARAGSGSGSGSGSAKSRLMSNIERMGGRGGE